MRLFGRPMVGSWAQCVARYLHINLRPYQAVFFLCEPSSEHQVNHRHFCVFGEFSLMDIKLPWLGHAPLQQDQCGVSSDLEEPGQKG